MNTWPRSLRPQKPPIVDAEYEVIDEPLTRAIGGQVATIVAGVVLLVVVELVALSVQSRREMWPFFIAMEGAIIVGAARAAWSLFRVLRRRRRARDRAEGPRLLKDGGDGLGPL